MDDESRLGVLTLIIMKSAVIVVRPNIYQVNHIFIALSFQKITRHLG